MDKEADTTNMAHEHPATYWKEAYDRMSARNWELSHLINISKEDSARRISRIRQRAEKIKRYLPLIYKDPLRQDVEALVSQVDGIINLATDLDPGPGYPTDILEQAASIADARAEFMLDVDGVRVHEARTIASSIRALRSQRDVTTDPMHTDATGTYASDAAGTPVTGSSWCACQPHEKVTRTCPLCGVGPGEACQGRVPQDDM